MNALLLCLLRAQGDTEEQLPEEEEDAQVRCVWCACVCRVYECEWGVVCVRVHVWCACACVVCVCARVCVCAHAYVHTVFIHAYLHSYMYVQFNVYIMCALLYAHVCMLCWKV